jgi:YfiH family protein
MVARRPAAGPLAWRERDGVVWLETALSGARAVFSTRLGGVSEGPYRSLNLGILTDDEAGSVQRNRGALATAVERDPRGFAIGLQVHGSELEVHRAPPERSAYAQRVRELPRVDGHLTDHPDVTPLVLVADCVPVVIAAHGAVGVVHCGWRGVAAGIVARAIESLRGLAGRGPAVEAVVGPGIGSCCYEVGEDVASVFRARGLAAALTGERLDLASAIALELERAGVRRRSISSAVLCTSCHPELFFSHRREHGVTGRQAGLAWLDI